MTNEQLQKLESLGILLSTYARHASNEDDSEAREKFVNEVMEIISQIKFV